MQNIIYKIQQRLEKKQACIVLPRRPRNRAMWLVSILAGLEVVSGTMIISSGCGILAGACIVLSVISSIVMLVGLAKEKDMYAIIALVIACVELYAEILNTILTTAKPLPLSSIFSILGAATGAGLALYLLSAKRTGWARVNAAPLRLGALSLICVETLLASMKELCEAFVEAAGTPTIRMGLTSVLSAIAQAALLFYPWYLLMLSAEYDDKPRMTKAERLAKFRADKSPLYSDEELLRRRLFQNRKG